MKSKFSLLILGMLVLVLTSCATTKMPLTTMTQDGLFLLTEFASSEDRAVLGARTSANTVCEKRTKGMAIIMKEETQYKGVVDEKLGTLAQKAGNVAKVFDQTRKAGEGIGEFSSDDYKTTVEFKCSDIM